MWAQIMIHGSLESLHEHVPPEILPETLGGPLSDEEAFDSKFEQRIVDNEKHYIEMAKWVTTKNIFRKKKLLKLRKLRLF